MEAIKWKTAEKHDEYDERERKIQRAWNRLAEDEAAHATCVEIDNEKIRETWDKVNEARRTLSSPTTTLQTDLAEIITKDDNEKILKLLNQSFGPGRFARSVYRLREIKGRETDFSYVNEKNNEILSSIQYFQTYLNQDLLGLLLGPLAVEPRYRGQGFGVALVEHTI